MRRNLVRLVRECAQNKELGDSNSYDGSNKQSSAIFLLLKKAFSRKSSLVIEHRFNSYTTRALWSTIGIRVAADTVTQRLDDLTEPFQELKSRILASPPHRSKRRSFSPRRRQSSWRNGAAMCYYHRTP
ncbi:unnamed protein product [Rodentolepis nana]|uniref:RUN domain-containing protein n=1 Tax=Rodentolepis nana TaxID=102285 RepID=A0A0R3TAC2_RODNA|nr:unnamed protein product [Rodentolepis nana]